MHHLLPRFTGAISIKLCPRWWSFQSLDGRHPGRILVLDAHRRERPRSGQARLGRQGEEEWGEQEQAREDISCGTSRVFLEPGAQSTIKFLEQALPTGAKGAGLSCSPRKHNVSSCWRFRYNRRRKRRLCTRKPCDFTREPLSRRTTVPDDAIRQERILSYDPQLMQLNWVSTGIRRKPGSMLAKVRSLGSQALC